MNPNSHPRFTNTLFTSVSPFVNSSDLFPTHDRRIGLTVSCGYHPEHKRVMVLVEEEQPSFLSTSIGEYVNPDSVESTVRQTCSQLADSCRRQAKELIEHAERLERLAKQKQPLIVISKLDKDSDHRIYDVEVRQTRPERTHQHQPRAFHEPVNNRSAVTLDMDDI
jgi:hypothetical protein